MLMGRLPGAAFAPGLEELLALDPALLELMAWPAPWRRPGPLAAYEPRGLPATRTPEAAPPAMPGAPAAAPLSTLMRRLAPHSRDGTTGGDRRSLGAAPATPEVPGAPANMTPDQRPRHPTMNVRPGTTPAVTGAAWEGIPVNFPRARGLEDAAWAIMTAPLGLVAPGAGTALSLAREALRPAEHQFRSLGPVVPGVPQTSQAMRAHWQKEGAIDAAGNIVRGGFFDPDGDGRYDSPAYRGQWDFSIGKERSPWRAMPDGGGLFNSATGEVRRAPSVAELAARTRALSATPARPGGRVALSPEALSEATRRNIAAQLARVGGSASSAFAPRDDHGRDRSAPARSAPGAGRTGIGPRGRQGAR
jgi:hypothetical protein